MAIDLSQLAGLAKTLEALNDHHDEAKPEVKHDLDGILNLLLGNNAQLKQLVELIVKLGPVIAVLLPLVKKLLAEGQAPKPVVIEPGPTPPSAPPVNPAPGDARVFPDEVELVSISASHPTHGDLGKCPISADGVISPPPALGTTHFDDNTDFVLEVGYKLKGAGIHFDNTPNATHLKRTSRYEFRNSGRAGAVARLDATRLESGGFMADGGQIRLNYDRTQGMDPTIKFPPKPHGPNGGEVLTLDIFAPDGGGDEVGRRYTFAPFN